MVVGFKTFGWWGFEFKAPENWDMSVDRGGFEKGYIRVDDPKIPRMEVSWESYKKDKIKSLNEIAENVQKELRKKSKDVRFIGKPKSTRVAKHMAKYLHWRILDDEGYVVFWYCDESLRFYRIQLLFKRDEYWSFKKNISEILKSFKCHMKRDVYTWTILDLALRLPSDFKLINRSYKVGNIMLTFESKYAYVFINRISIADVVLEEKYEGDLKNVLEKEHLPSVRAKFKISKFKYSKRFHDEYHSGFMMGTTYKIGILMRKEFLVRTKIWVCKKSNKIYIITTAIRRGPEAARVRRKLNTLLSSMCCKSLE